ncbi:MAG: tRNA (pseudouridine(54)-N(1))-methyltransferase TrmY [Candidatus Methanomethylophilaceae archaeon]|nr:tRNA (pseudouridine(54)-N(1))-methyltransferase TrmY [Candidatus Methanomethylophilaceae archaeon]
MRYFVIVGHRAAITGDFKLDDIAGGAGRLDILVRCVNSAFFLSHDLRKDVEAYLVCEGGQDAPKTVVFKGSELRYLNPDERSTASLIRNALLKPLEDGEVKSSPGVYVSRSSFSDVIKTLSEKGRLVYMKEDGQDCREYEYPEDPVFVLGDNRDLTEEEEADLLSYSPDRICIGPCSLHADHCMIVVHNDMDRREVCP